MIRALAVQARTGSVRILRCESPVPRADDVLLEPLEVGVCGTDREILRSEHGAPPDGEAWLIPGHEALCRVVAVGDAVRDLAEGDLVVPMVRRPCADPACAPCRAGRQDFCRSGGFRERGIDRAHGFLAERTLDTAEFLVPVPPELRDVAVLAEPLTIAEKAVAQIDAVQSRLPWSCGRDPAGCRALVLGAGPVALLGALKLLQRGFETAVCSRGAPDTPGARWATEVGARYVCSREVPPERLARAVGEASVVYEATGSAPFAFDVLTHALANNGVFVFTGIPGSGGERELEGGPLMTDLVLRNQVALGSVNAGRDDYRRAVADLAAFQARWPGKLARLITSRYALEGWRDSLEDGPGALKSVIEPCAGATRSRNGVDHATG